VHFHENTLLVAAFMIEKVLLGAIWPMVSGAALMSALRQQRISTSPEIFPLVGLDVRLVGPPASVAKSEGLHVLSAALPIAFVASGI